MQVQTTRQFIPAKQTNPLKCLTAWLNAFSLCLYWEMYLRPSILPIGTCLCAIHSTVFPHLAQSPSRPLTSVHVCQEPVAFEYIIQFSSSVFVKMSE